MVTSISIIDPFIGPLSNLQGPTILGTNRNDTLLGGANADHISAGKGNDFLSSYAGNDTLDGGDGLDWLFGGDGNDLLMGGASNDYLNGGAGNDILDGGTGSDQMYGNAGDDTYYIDNPNDLPVEFSNNGYDTLLTSVDFSISNFNTEKVQLIEGSAAKVFRGQRNDELIIGNSNDNLIRASWGSDTLIGGAGNDTIQGEWGNDTLTGGTGRDRFVVGYDAAFGIVDMGMDTITDFNPNEDTLSLSNRTFSKLRNTAIDFATVNSDLQAAASSALLVYNQTNGKLSYNENGSQDGFGRGGDFAVLSSSLSGLSNSNFIVGPILY